MTPETTNAAQSTGGPTLRAVAARDYRFKRYLLVAILFGYGLWSIRDGFVRYPRENAERIQNFPGTALPHPGYDVQLNKALGMILPPLALCFLAFSFYASRGEIRLQGDTLSIPGHPPIPLNALRRVDRSRWDRKGIAYVDYQIPGTAKAGTFKLDDFVYDRDPIDGIFNAIERVLVPGSGVKPEAAPMKSVVSSPVSPLTAGKSARTVAAVRPAAIKPPGAPRP